MRTTNATGTYHSGTFKEYAEKVGLAVLPSTVVDTTSGYARMGLGRGTRNKFRAELRALQNLTPSLTELATEIDQSKARGTVQVVAECGCGPQFNVRLSKAAAERGSVQCSVCGQAYAPRTQSPGRRGRPWPN
ncbi:hypothetical protein [Longimycelium tulufanense]|uniref:hypothetical protein n=1 Tax=Longimycelium tulufanense TaxID=907463 RepID=UPI00166D4138|nr:hypothetical protein [Longimycelium tulufanense]